MEVKHLAETRIYEIFLQINYRINAICKIGIFPRECLIINQPIYFIDSRHTSIKRKV